jgi:hypothetical protein
LYELPKAPASLPAAYSSAVQAVWNAPRRRDLRPLERDEEFLAWYGSAPNFIPRLGEFCSLDVAGVDRRVQNLVDRIQGRDNPKPRIPGVPERMTVSFLRMYRSMLASYEARMEQLASQLAGLTQQLNDPGLTPEQAATIPGQIAAIEGQMSTLASHIASVQTKIDQLTAFLSRLRAG